jgi:non-ribosomal peptide synthase protein (TIGR01720 family)
MLRAAAARDESGAVRHIVLCVHHLAIDAVSWPILLEDIADAYAGGAGRERAPSFVAWADALARATGAGRFDDDADYWAALAGDGAAIPHDSNGAFTEGSVETLEIALDTTSTAAVLHDIHGVHNTQIEDVLVTAIARTLATWLGAPRVRLGIERHGREALVDGFDLSLAVGWFTSYFPVDIRLGEVGGPDDLRSVKEQLRAIPRKGASFGILRYLRDGAIGDRVRAVAPPDVVFNYAGRVDANDSGPAPWRLVDLPFASRDRSNERRHAIEVNAFVRDGALRTRWTFGRHQLRRETIDRLAQFFLDELRGLVASARAAGTRGYTPSDFPDAHLSQDELDRLFRELDG